MAPNRRLLAMSAAAPALWLTMAGPAVARDSLGVFGVWGAFRDAAIPRCYAIAMAMADPAAAARERQPYLTIGTWPRRDERNQVHLRLSRRFAAAPAPALTIAGARFVLIGNGREAWSRDRRMDAAIVAAMRSARSLRVNARDGRGRPFVDRYSLAGAATAMDSATLACARD